MDKILNTRSKVSSSGPNVFNESNLFWIDFELLSEPAIVELNTLIFEENELIGFVEDLNAYHHKTWIVPSSKSYVIQIVESEAKLRADQRISWWVHFASNTIGLEAKDSCSNIINIVSPTGYYRIAVYFGTGNSRGC